MCEVKSCVLFSVLLSIVLLIFATINAFTCVFTDKIIYETPVRSQFNITSIEFITSKIADIDQSLVAFVYFVIYMIGEVFKSCYLVNCRRTKSRIYLNPDGKAEDTYMIDPNAPPGMTPRQVKVDPKKQDILTRNNAHMRKLLVEKPVQDNRGFSAIFVYPILFILLHVLCGITNVFMLVRVASLSCALEVIRFVFRDTRWIILVEFTSLALIWISLLIASARLPNKLVLVVCIVGSINMTLEIIARHFPRVMISVIPPFVQMIFNSILLATCCVGYFY